MTNIIKEFCDKDYAEAIGNVIGAVSTIVLGSESGNASEEKGYFVIVGPTGAIMRIDYLVYFKSVKAKGLLKVADNFYMCSYVVSSVDLNGLTFNDFASAVDLCYGSLPV